ncbi:MAG: TonB-dependent receptor [Lewinellaceae bacterium]|nr:TonB-dependent receptor [Lewinellaceae bacterium]
MKNIFSLFLAILLPFLSSGQSVLSGRIVDAETQKPLSFATLAVEGFSAGAYADEQGRFELEIPEQAPYTIIVQHIGYEMLKYPVGKKVDQLHLELQSMPIVIENILVQGSKVENAAQSDVILGFARHVSHPKDVADLFKDTPGFGLVKRGGYAMDPVFRSFRNEQLNVQYDGGVQVMHACPNRMDPITTHVAPEEVERIELIKGPFSVRYGQTMGGVLNIITQQPEPAESFTIGGAVESGYEFNGDSRLARLTLNAAGKGYDLTANGGARDFGNYKNGDGMEIPSSFKSYDYAAKLGIHPFSGHRLQLGWRQSFGRDILHVGLPMDTREDNSSVLSLDYVAKNLSPRLYSATFKAFVSSVDHIMSNELRPNFMMTDAVATVDALTAGGKLELSWQPGSRMQLYTGLDFRSLARDGSRIRLVKRNMMTGEPLEMPMRFEDLIWQDARLNDIGLFTESRYFVTERLVLTAGARLDRVEARVQGPAPDFAELYPALGTETEWNISGNLSADYRLDEHWNTQLALGRGTRTASMEERFINHFTLGADLYEYVGNPFLRPEANHQVEWSLGRQSDRLSIKLSAFYSYITDYITAAVDSSLSRKYMPTEEPRFARRFQNIDAAVQKGFELEASVQLPKHLQFYAMASYTHARNLDWNEPLPEIPPFSATTGLKYERKRFTLDFKGRFVAGQERIAPSFGESRTPGFSVFDFQGHVKPARGLSVGAAVLNIFDRNYYEHLNRGYRNMPEQGLIYEPGRNVTAFVRYEF